MSNSFHADVVVLGAGPGGYAAAFRAADLGKSVILIDKDETLGGVCLNRGCIPSKALLHLARVKSESAEVKSFGLTFPEPEWDLEAVKQWKNERVVGRLTNGIAALAKARKVQIVTGSGVFTSPTSIEVTQADGVTEVTFEDVIIAVGSHPTKIPGFPEDPRIMDSTSALDLDGIPENLLIIGGGYIGLEMGTIYSALGSKVTVVEFMPNLLPGADPDVVKPLQKRLMKDFASIQTGTKVFGIDPQKDYLEVKIEGKSGPETMRVDKVLVAVGRRPNTFGSGFENIGLDIDERGFIKVDEKRQTNVPHVYAIGDITGDPMLAHKATHEGKVAAEVICGQPAAFDVSIIPAVIFTDPEIAWAGLTETQAKEQGIAYDKGVFPWSASGRALALGRTEGFSKALFDKESGKLIGMSIVGTNAGDLIAEAVLAMEMGADAEDIALIIHPHPSLSESVGNAAEIVAGSITDLFAPKK
ncbi:MAG: dihydrolipoyl dehydrogenase [Candidatus Marinimicrobia bacterium]|jgi:dihydrolipoamide dehydrogenase|nr:dihydrolipoyl dehydrogenase [Candidatus Neomarinimicrobiota bacterium]MBT3574969.1 dihydrolipoyl dehydrogenase [Candidatus Neomarinimicrobiota bacterium]MBT3679191.1 dihydrolipoyl dehydrogenase [Candidatus Neomarinimicrobiota bacterium]MBT3950985.1 dihydrolipoyl dehydrogenase [Candidatus Neomarinimicrobiota bacterium]MBT4253601.1 dihydrolipoyl dehydrogenase [Candidatus Neomarinimicrobiota bacterium]